MPKVNTLKRIKRLESAGDETYLNVAHKAYQAGKITAEERALYLDFINNGNVIPIIEWVDMDPRLAQVLRKVSGYPVAAWADRVE
ncbi:MAG: hypothetical protein LAT68_15615 [Cyclobacteriaceae bacterium]|nr:hypothetical protein [Cyclobacteriaceae bacterium]